MAKVGEATEGDVNTAVAAAKAAFPKWSAMSPNDRGKCLGRLADLIEQNHAEFARLEALSMGKPVRQYFDSYAAASHWRYFSQAVYPQGSSSLNTPGFVNMVLRQPVGIVACVIPWNVALLFFSNKAAPALAAGCTVVVKSSEKAPLTSLKLASLIEEAGFPPGVLNVLSGHGAVSGAALASHMDVRAISFTGSTRTGRAIQKAAADSNMKNVVCELGGKSPVLIFEDANIDNAVEATESSIMTLSGQVCMANSRVYVQKSIAEKFISKFKELAESRKLGDPLSKDTTQGPQADKIQHKNVLDYIEHGKKSGTLLTGGDNPFEDGCFVSPTIFLNQPEDAKVMKEEIFGPVVTINTFETEEEALKKANDTEYGLYAAVFTKDIDRAMRISKGLEAGTVGINCTSPSTAPDMPFGGYKSSGVGREDFIKGMEPYLETKSVLIKVDGLS